MTKNPLPAHLLSMPDEALKEMLQLIEAKHRLELRDRAQHSFMPFVHHVYDNFIEGRHHRVMAEKLEAVARGECKRLIVCMPPRHSKSELSSYLMPAWFLGRNPKLKIIQATHNTDLAVRFGRKVRDLIDDPKYAEIFPHTLLKEDSKSAGRWETNVGGEYFACLTPETRVHTPQGLTPVAFVKVGDKLLNASGEVEVQEVYHSQHEATVRFGNVACSKNHPIWTMSRGWVEAGALSPRDILCVESIYDKLKASLRGLLHGPVEHTNVSSVVQHKVSVRKPEQREVSIVRRPWDRLVRSLAVVREFLAGHGAPAIAAAHSGPDRRERALQPGQLSLGHGPAAGEQHAFQRAPEGQDACGAGAGLTDHPRGASIPPEQRFVGDGGSVLGKAPKEALERYSPPDDLGWIRRCAVWLLVRGRQGGEPQQTRNGLEGRLEGLRWGAHHVFGFFLGVRPVGDIRTQEHGPRPFVNFLVSGDHTFFAEGILTHNCGVGAAMTGRGADLLVIDDAHSEQDALSETAFDNAYEWYTSGPRQRLQPGGSIIVVMTRWSKKDLVGRLLGNQMADTMADQWEVVEFPALLPSGDPLWPEFWDKDSLLSIKGSLPSSKWEAQWQQKPTGSGSAVIRKEWWKSWDKEKIPPLKYIIQAYDTAFSKKESADYSAITTWGVFEPQEGGKDAIILMDAQRGRWNFPELKEVAFEEYSYWEPDMVIIEAKASGIPLIDELSARGIPALAFSPGRRTKGRGGVDKALRVHLVSPLFEAGLVWAPQDKRFAEEVIDEVCSFPNGEHDDFVDSMTLALLRFRQGGFIRIHEEEEEDIRDSLSSRKREYY
jgi:predicted phage terminase large subunit-like protein